MKTFQLFTLILSLGAASALAAGKGTTGGKAGTPSPSPSASAGAPGGAPGGSGGCPAYAGSIAGQAQYGAGMNPPPAAPGGTQTAPSLPPDLVAAGVTSWPTMDKPPPTDQSWFRSVDVSMCPNDPPRANLSSCGKLSVSQDSDNPTCAFSCGGCVKPTSPGIPADWVQCQTKGDWGLTFDDGPASSESGNLLTNAVSPANGIKAQMFIVGSRVVEFPQTLQLEYNAGHVISVHTWSHSALTTQTTKEVIAEVLWTEKIIHTVIGKTPKYFRPPYGDVDNRVRCILKQLGYTNIIWLVDTGDFDAGAPGFDAQNWLPGNFSAWVKQYPATGTVFPISLDHDIHIQGVKAMPESLCILKQAGYNPVPPSTCNGDTNPYQDALSTSTNGTTAGGVGSTGSAANGTSASSATNVVSNAPFALFVSLLASFFL